MDTTLDKWSSVKLSTVGHISIMHFLVSYTKKDIISLT